MKSIFCWHQISALGGFKNSPKSLREFVPPKVTSMFLMFGHEGLMITNTVKASGESWNSAIIYRKRSAFLKRNFTASIVVLPFFPKWYSKYFRQSFDSIKAARNSESRTGEEETCTTPPRKTTMPHTYDGMTINKVCSRKPLEPTVSKRNTPCTI